MERGKYPSEELDQYMIRFPDGMRDELKAAAAANGRSLNAEIVARLQASLSGGSSDIADVVKQALREVLQEQRNDKA